MAGYLRVSEIMTPTLILVGPEDTLAGAARKMADRKAGSVLVVDGPTLVGILTERDLVRAVAEGLDPAGTPVARVMTPDPITMPPDEDIVHAARTMAERSIRHLPVTEESRVLGIISIRDVLRWGVEALAFDAVADEARETIRVLGNDGRAR